jgi:hypothetical protein
VLAGIERGGAKAEAARLKRQGRYDAVLRQIETGRREWLKVAERLRPALDAGGGEALSFAVARALPRAPAGVLGLVGRGWRLEAVCTSPFIEPDPGVAERYEAQALAALKTAPPALKPLAARCAAAVKLPPS